MTNSRALSFAADIRPLFTDTDIEHMKIYGLDLSSCEDVAKEAKNIFSAVTAGTMPPPADGSFVEVASRLLTQAGYDASRVKTERFGPTGTH